MKIGILTHYYNSKNYGGILQSYALVKVLAALGYDAEQICFPYWSGLSISDSKKNNESSKNIKSNIIHLVIRKLKNKYADYRNKQLYIDINNRNKQFLEFQSRIKHSNIEYDLETMFLCNESYDTFIVGSDQVWNLLWYNPAFFLEFADNDKKKIAYATSAGSSYFDNTQKKYLARNLNRFDAISVREKDLVKTYKTIANVDSSFVLDPVLLLDKNDWDSVASNIMIKEKYIFCFFYSPTNEEYTLVKRFAKKHKLKITTIPYANQDINNKIDDKYGDYRMVDASPSDFISLIKNAEYIFTDSFHCCAFSIIYNKPFFVFSRRLLEEMNGRIESILKIFDCEERFCNSIRKVNIEYIESINNAVYSFEKYESLKKESINYLINSLKNEK